MFSRLHPNFSLALAHLWSNSSRDAKGIEAERFNGKEKELMYQHALEVLKTRSFDYFVFGHRHLMLDIDIQQARFINLGDWLANFSYGVFDGESFELKKVDEAQISKLRPVF